MNNGGQSCGRLDFCSTIVPTAGLAFSGFERILVATRHAEIAPCVAELEAALADGYHAMGLIAYEAAAAFDSALTTAPSGPLPLLWFGLSRDPLPEPIATDGEGLHFNDWQPASTEDDYRASFDRVQGHIHDGNTYQLNLTFPLRTTCSGDHAAGYARLQGAQPSGYCACIQTPEWSVLSASPELFFEKVGSHIHSRPMKGTRKRGLTLAQDQAIAKDLRNNPKDQAENVMIVDLIRNDIGRVAVSGSVHVPELFKVEKYPTVWQMTSTVAATVKPDLSLFQLLAGLFPCGSITGAPKVKTMSIIAEEEQAPRGVYCGSVGYLKPNGDCVFNVAIRTLTIIDDQAEYPVGSGVVSDSTSDNEYEECLIKARVLDREPASAFQLLETLRWRPDEGYYLLDRHLSRISQSAEYFSFPFDSSAVRQQLDQAAAQWTGQMRVRLLIDQNGEIEIQSFDMPSAASPFTRARLARDPIDSNNVFLYHKTTCRDVYAPATAERTSDTDVILFNERDELTESTIANVALKLDGVWYTPPISCGLLAGTMREKLLATGELTEKVLLVDDLQRAQGIRLINSVRGAVDVEEI